MILLTNAEQVSDNRACAAGLRLKLSRRRQGKNLKQVQGWLRHSQLTTTLNVYIHDTDAGLGGADAWDDMLGAKDPDGSENPRPVSHVASGGQHRG